MSKSFRHASSFVMTAVIAVGPVYDAWATEPLPLQVTFHVRMTRVRGSRTTVWCLQRMPLESIWAVAVASPVIDFCAFRPTGDSTFDEVVTSVVIRWTPGR
jgi:hypothetical protein